MYREISNNLGLEDYIIYSDRVDMVVKLRVQYCRFFPRINLRPINLRPINRFYDVKLISEQRGGNNFSAEKRITEIRNKLLIILVIFLDRSVLKFLDRNLLFIERVQTFLDYSLSLAEPI